MLTAQTLPLYSKFVLPACLQCVHQKVSNLNGEGRIQTKVEPCERHTADYGSNLRDFVVPSAQILPLLPIDFL